MSWTSVSADLIALRDSIPEHLRVVFDQNTAAVMQEMTRIRIQHPAPPVVRRPQHSGWHYVDVEHDGVLWKWGERAGGTVGSRGWELFEAIDVVTGKAASDEAARNGASRAKALAKAKAASEAYDEAPKAAPATPEPSKIEDRYHAAPPVSSADERRIAAWITEQLPAVGFIQQRKDKDREVVEIDGMLFQFAWSARKLDGKNYVRAGIMPLGKAARDTLGTGAWVARLGPVDDAGHVKVVLQALRNRVKPPQTEAPAVKDYTTRAAGIARGRAAFAEKRPRIPYHDPYLRDAYTKGPVPANEYIDGWMRGWDDANIEANRAPEPEPEPEPEPALRDAVISLPSGWTAEYIEGREAWVITNESDSNEQVKLRYWSKPEPHYYVTSSKESNRHLIGASPSDTSETKAKKDAAARGAALADAVRMVNAFEQARRNRPLTSGDRVWITDALNESVLHEANFRGHHEGKAVVVMTKTGMQLSVDPSRIRREGPASPEPDGWAVIVKAAEKGEPWDELVRKAGLFGIDARRLYELRPEGSRSSASDQRERWAALFPPGSYLNRFFAEKVIPEREFSVTDSKGLDHHIPNEVVVEAIAQTQGAERKKIEDTLRQIDFRNGDVNHYLEFLAKGLAENYEGALREPVRDQIHGGRADGAVLAQAKGPSKRKAKVDQAAPAPAPTLDQQIAASLVSKEKEKVLGEVVERVVESHFEGEHDDRGLLYLTYDDGEQTRRWRLFWNAGQVDDAIYLRLTLKPKQGPPVASVTGEVDEGDGVEVEEQVHALMEKLLDAAIGGDPEPPPAKAPPPKTSPAVAARPGQVWSDPSFDDPGVSTAVSIEYLPAADVDPERRYAVTWYGTPAGPEDRGDPYFASPIERDFESLAKAKQAVEREFAKRNPEAAARAAEGDLSVRERNALRWIALGNDPSPAMLKREPPKNESLIGKLKRLGLVRGDRELTVTVAGEDVLASASGGVPHESRAKVGYNPASRKAPTKSQAGRDAGAFLGRYQHRDALMGKGLGNLHPDEITAQMVEEVMWEEGYENAPFPTQLEAWMRSIGADGRKAWEDGRAAAGGSALRKLPAARSRRQRLKEAAVAGAHGKDWYQKAQREIEVVAKAWGVAPEAVAVAVAATSPATAVVLSPRMKKGGGRGSNIGKARTVVKRLVLQGVGSEALHPKTPGLSRLHEFERCAREGLEAPACVQVAFPTPDRVKTHAFVRNLLGDGEAVTVDRHLARVATGGKTMEVSPAQYEQIVADVRAVARELGWEPRQVMAAVWTAAGGTGELQLATAAERQRVGRGRHAEARVALPRSGAGGVVLYHGSPIENLRSILGQGLQPGAGISPHQTKTTTATFFTDKQAAALLYATARGVVLEIDVEGLDLHPDYDDAGYVLDAVQELNRTLDADLRLGDPIPEELVDAVEEYLQEVSDAAESHLDAPLTTDVEDGQLVLAAEPLVGIPIDGSAYRDDPELYEHDHIRRSDWGEVRFYANQYLCSCSVPPERIRRVFVPEDLLLSPWPGPWRGITYYDKVVEDTDEDTGETRFTFPTVRCAAMTLDQARAMFGATAAPAASATHAAYVDEGMVGEHWGTRGSGILFVTTAGGSAPRVLLVKRAPGTQTPNVWSIPGGAIPRDADGGYRDAFESALAEAREEVGYSGVPVPYGEVDWQAPGSQFQYKTFLVEVPTAFRPQLQWEHTDARWVTFDEASALPLHPGLRAVWDEIRRIDRSATLS